MIACALPPFKGVLFLYVFVEIERMVKYKTNDIIKNVNEYVNLINSARVQKNFLERNGSSETTTGSCLVQLPVAYEQSGIEKERGSDGPFAGRTANLE